MMESEMHTHLMPDEMDIVSIPPRMEWKKAVSIIENLVQQHIEKADDEDDMVFRAWNRIQAG